MVRYVKLDVLLFDVMLAAIAYAWAAIAGASVALQVGGTVKLNDTPAAGLPHSLYVSETCVLVGAIWLAGLSVLRGGERPQWPKRTWSCFGGFVTAPTFVTTPAAQLLGTQMVLMILLIGMIGAALVFDCMAHRLQMTKRKFSGLFLLLVGVGLELVDALPKVEGNVLLVVIYCVAVLISGCLFGLQAKMNKRLARDLGSTARAAAACNFSVLIWGTPIWLVLYFGMNVPLYFRKEDWWIWALCGLQSAFYTYSLAELPKMIGYSTVFILVLAGKLLTAATADTTGMFAPAVPLSPWRCASVAAMLLGAVLYSMEKVADTPSAGGEECGSFVETVHNVDVTDDLNTSLRVTARG